MASRADFSKVPGMDVHPGKELTHMVHYKDKKDGHHVVEHHHKNAKLHPPERHHLKDMDEVHGHMEDHMGMENPGEAEANAGQSGISPDVAAAGAGAPPPAAAAAAMGA